MIERPANVVIMVKDQVAALDFYTSKLGFEKRTDIPAPPGGQRWVTVAPKGQELEMSLFQVSSNSDPNAPQNQWHPAGAAIGTFTTTDCKKDFEELSSRGVKFNEPKPAEYPFGIVASFSDPDGNRFTLLQPRRGG
jgi:predicted enzyme related to lactoylglutathione lyase